MNDIPGEYQAVYQNGTRSLKLERNYDFEDKFVYLTGKQISTKGQWKVSDDKSYDKHLYLQSCLNIRNISSSEKLNKSLLIQQTECLLFVSNLFGRYVLNNDPDDNEHELKKVK